MAAGNSRRTDSKVDVGTHLSEQEVIKDAFKNSKEWNLVEQKSVFAESQLRKKDGWSVKNQAVLCSRWAM